MRKLCKSDIKREKMLLSNKLILMLIQNVKQQKILYDANEFQLSNNFNRRRVWQDLAKKLNMSVPQIKLKWKGLRDMYIRHLKFKLGKNNKYKAYKRWCWVDHMSFLKPHIEERLIYGDNVVESMENHDIKEEEGSNDATDGKESVEDSSENIVLEMHVDETHDSSSKLLSSDPIGFQLEDTNNHLYINANSKQKKERRNSVEYVEGETSFDCIPRDKVMELDGLDHLFLGYAKTIKKLPMKNQINVKFRIAKLIMIEELKCLE